MTDPYQDVTDEQRAYLDSLTDEQARRFVDIALQITTGQLRQVTLPDGTGVLVDGDDPNTNEEIRAALEDDQP